jgi:hypothetical protein
VESGIGIVLVHQLQWLPENPSLTKQLFSYSILGFALTEAIALFNFNGCVFNFICYVVLIYRILHMQNYLLITLLTKVLFFCFTVEKGSGKNSTRLLSSTDFFFFLISQKDSLADTSNNNDGIFSL